jgi:hypothetical protein
MREVGLRQGNLDGPLSYIPNTEPSTSTETDPQVPTAPREMSGRFIPCTTAFSRHTP